VELHARACQSTPQVPAFRASLGWRFETGAFLREALSSRRIPEADTIPRPGHRFTSSRVMTSTLSSLVQKRIEGVDHGRISRTHSRSR
jgi:hypothetical protein